MIIEIPGEISGLVVSIVSAVYFVKIYKKTHLFSIFRFLFIGIASMFVFFILSSLINYQEVFEQKHFELFWNIALFSSMCGWLCAVFCLGMACAGIKGRMGNILSCLLNCEVRRKNL